MKVIIGAALAAIIMLGAALPADAATTKSNGGTTVVTTNKVWKGTLRDKTPARAGVIIAFQKKAGPTKCRINAVTVKRNGRTYRFGPYEKWSRTYSRAGGWWLPRNGRDRRLEVRIATNGRCIVGVAIR